MGETAIQWEEIKKEYITTHISQRQLADKYGISSVALNNHSRKEGWMQQREEYIQKCQRELDTKKPNPSDIPGLISGGEGGGEDRETKEEKQNKRAKFQRYALATIDLKPIEIADPIAVAQRAEDYFACCYQNDIKPQKPGLAKWLGVNRVTLDKWYRGEQRGSTHRVIMERAFGILEEDLYEQLQSGQISPPSGIFLLKNMFGYKDEQEVVVAKKDPLGDLQSPEELRKRIEGTVVHELEEAQGNE